MPTVAQALNELKLLDARIQRAIAQAQFVAGAVGENRINGRTTKEFTRDAEAAWQSTHDLMTRRMTVKTALTESNARTMVTIGDRSMTVAAAIEHRKHSIGYKRALLKQMHAQWAAAVRLVDQHNAQVRAQAEQRAAAAANGLAPEAMAALIEQLVAAAMERDEMRLVNPLALADKITALETEIEAFDAGFDLAINASNYTTEVAI